MTLVAARVDSWQELAVCIGRGPLFYGPPAEQPHAKIHRELEAVKVCKECPVRAECLRDALERDERHGVWGAKTEDERQRIALVTGHKKQVLKAAPRIEAPSLFDSGVDDAEARWRDAEAVALAYHGGTMRPYGCECASCGAAARALVDYQWIASYGAAS